MKNKITMGMNTIKDFNQITLEDGYKDFIRAKTAKNLSEDTLKSYDNIFKSFCSVIPKDTLCFDVKIEHLYYFVEMVKNRNENITDKSIETYMRIPLFVFLCSLFCFSCQELWVTLLLCIQKIKI